MFVTKLLRNAFAAFCESFWVYIRWIWTFSQHTKFLWQNIFFPFFISGDVGVILWHVSEICVCVFYFRTKVVEISQYIFFKRFWTLFIGSAGRGIIFSMLYERMNLCIISVWIMVEYQPIGASGSIDWNRYHLSLAVQTRNKIAVSAR